MRSTVPAYLSKPISLAGSPKFLDIFNEKKKSVDLQNF